MTISLICFIGAGLCLIVALLIQGFGPLVMNTSAEDRRGINAITVAVLIIGGFLVYGGFDAAQ